MATQSGSHGFSTARRVVHAHRQLRAFTICGMCGHARRTYAEAMRLGRKSRAKAAAHRASKAAS